MRKMISFKIENLPEKEHKIVDEWASKQTNIQQSLGNLIMHIVDYVGCVDVMEFEVQRKLHTIFSKSEAVEEPFQFMEIKETLNERKREQKKNDNDDFPNPVEMFDD